MLLVHDDGTSITADQGELAACLPGVGPNDVWAMDFVHDQLATGRKIRVLTVVDTFSRYVPVLDPRFTYRGEDVVATLDRICRRMG